MSRIEAGQWFEFPRGKLDYATTKGTEAMVLHDVGLLFAFQELRRQGYEAYVGNMTINREHYQKRHQTGYKKKFGDLWEVLLDLDRRAGEGGLKAYHPHYFALRNGESLAIKVTVNGQAPASDQDRYLEMAKAAGVTPAVLSVNLRRRRTKFLVEGYDLQRL